MISDNSPRNVSSTPNENLKKNQSKKTGLETLRKNQENFRILPFHVISVFVEKFDGRQKYQSSTFQVDGIKLE